MFCNYCGCELNDSSEFCMRCGNKVASRAVVDSEPPKASGFHVAGNLDDLNDVAPQPRESFVQVNREPENVYGGSKPLDYGRSRDAVIPPISEPVAVPMSERAVGFGSIDSAAGTENRASVAPAGMPMGMPTGVPAGMPIGAPVIPGYEHPRQPMVKKEGFVNMIVLAVLFLISVLAIPMYNKSMFGDLIPSDNSIFLTDIIDALANARNPFAADPVLVTVVMGVIGIGMLISSIAQGKVMCIITSTLAMAGMLFVAGVYISEWGPDMVFAFENTPICMGFWLALFVSVCCFIRSLMLKKTVYYV